jgi:hypothetical protein
LKSSVVCRISAKSSLLVHIQKQRDLLSKKEAALKAESRGKVLLQIVKMANDASLTLVEIASAFDEKKPNAQILLKKLPSRPTC